MKMNIKQIYVLDIGYLYVGNSGAYKEIKITKTDENVTIFQCFNHDGEIVREILGSYVIAVDYE
jgi:hypothetical protein